MKKYLIFSGVLLLLLVGVFFFGSSWGKHRAFAEIEPQRDTVVIYKTKSGGGSLPMKEFFKGFDVTIPNMCFLTIPDTLRVPEIVTIHDTVMIYVPLSQQYFEENGGRLRIWTTGYKVSLDKWEVDESETVLTPKPKYNKLFVEGTAIYDKSPFLPLTVNYGYEKNGLMYYGGAGYDFISKSPVIKVGIRWTPFSW